MRKQDVERKQRSREESKHGNKRLRGSQGNEEESKHERGGMKTKRVVLTSPPPAARPSCIHLDGDRRS